MNKLNSLAISSSGSAIEKGFLETHQSHDYAQHRNNDFLPWHRIFLHYFEKEVQKENKHLNLSYFGFANQTAYTNDIIFLDAQAVNKGLLGQQSTWSFRRNFNLFDVDRRRNYPIESISSYTNEISALLAINDYDNLRWKLEESGVTMRSLHDVYHRWIGGHNTAAANDRGSKNESVPLVLESNTVKFPHSSSGLFIIEVMDQYGRRYSKKLIVE